MLGLLFQLALADELVLWHCSDLCVACVSDPEQKDPTPHHAFLVGQSVSFICIFA